MLEFLSNPQNIEALMFVIGVIVCAVLTVAALALRMYIKVKGATLKKEEREMLEGIAAHAVGAAEEFGARTGIKGAGKRSYAVEVIRAHFPNIKADALDNAIDHALSVIEIGNAGRSDGRTVTAEKPVPVA